MALYADNMSTSICVRCRFMVRHEERTRWATTQGQARLSIEVPSKQALGSAANLVEQTWYSRMPRTVQAVCGEIELSHHLEYATYVRVAMLDDGFAGIVAAAPTSAYRHHNPESVSALWFRTTRTGPHHHPRSRGAKQRSPPPLRPLPPKWCCRRNFSRAMTIEPPGNSPFWQ